MDVKDVANWSSGKLFSFQGEGSRKLSVFEELLLTGGSALNVGQGLLGLLGLGWDVLNKIRF
jgi:hypothetical protein